MDAGTVDAINRRDVQLIAERLDNSDEMFRAFNSWHDGPIAETIMGENCATFADRDFLVACLAERTVGVHFDGHPADCDWENLYSHFRAAILARRDPSNPTGGLPPLAVADVV